MLPRISVYSVLVHLERMSQRSIIVAKCSNLSSLVSLISANAGDNKTGLCDGNISNYCYRQLKVRSVISIVVKGLTPTRNVVGD